MPTFSEIQLTSIAQELHDLSTAVGQIRLSLIHKKASLSDPKVVQLLGLQWSLLNTSSSFYVQAANVTLADADAAATEITASINAANNALKNLTIVDQVITIASAAGVLAAAIMTGDMAQIGTAVQGVYDAIT